VHGTEGGTAGGAAGSEVLFRLSEALRGLEEPEQIQVVACRILGEHLGVNRVTYGDVQGDGFVIGPAYVNGVKPFPKCRTPFASYGPSIMETCGRGEPLAVPDVQTSPLFSEAERRNYVAADIRAFVLAMLLKGGRFVAAFGASTAAPRAWTSDEVRLIREVGERTWSALSRARADAGLRRSEESLRGLVDALESGFSVCELVRDEASRPVDYRILEVNAAFEHLTGLDRRNILGRPMAEMFGGALLPWLETYARVA